MGCSAAGAAAGTRRCKESKRCILRTLCRAALLQISAYGPAFGSAAALVAVVFGLGLSAAGIGGSELQPVAFNDSLLVGALGGHRHELTPIHG